MKSSLITETMIKDHEKIINLLVRFEKSIGQDKLTIAKSFDDLTWGLEKHFFTEEKAIFTKYEPEEETKGHKMISELIKEHKEIFDKLKTMKKSFKKKKTFDFQEFENLLTRHKNFEEKTVYPMLDSELDESEKISIVKRINDISLTDSS